MVNIDTIVAQQEREAAAAQATSQTSGEGEQIAALVAGQLAEIFGGGEEKPETLQEFLAVSPFAWTTIIGSHVFDSLRAWEEATGQLEGMAESQFDIYSKSMFSAIYNKFLLPNNPEFQHFLGVNDVSELTANQLDERRLQHYQNDPAGIAEMIRFGLSFIGGQMGVPLTLQPPSGTSGSGRGRSGPSAQDIRNQFDIEELSVAVDDMSRMLVFEPHRGAKALARQYVDLIVKGKGEVNVDFETFIRSDIAKTARFKSIYRQKPDSLKAEQYMAPFFQAARQVARPGEAADLAIEGAQVGADPLTFSNRLARTDAVTGSAPFINALQGRLEGLNQIFKGS